MAILVFNAGSSSLKFAWFIPATNGSPQRQASGAIENFGAAANWRWKSERAESGHAAIKDHADAAEWVINRLRMEQRPIEAIGHRVVHGGEHFREPVLLNKDVVAQLRTLNSLAPLHNPPAIAVIDRCANTFSDVPMVAMFDTAFHSTLPEHAYRYAIPSLPEQAHPIRRYGFHGIAHRFLYERYRQLAPDAACQRVISFQLGNGCSVSAIQDGRSVDTSMGYTPLEGLIMSTRCGDIDPGVLLQLTEQLDLETLTHALHHASGLLALSGASADMRELLAKAATGHASATLAIDAFCHRARKYLGAYLAVLGGADAILFGGGIGENAPAIRQAICTQMQWCGLQLDSAANESAIGVERLISPPTSRPAVYVIPVDEELLIARATRALLA